LEGGGGRVAYLKMESMVGDIQANRSKVDILVVSLHVGVEYPAAPSPRRQRLCREIAEAGHPDEAHRPWADAFEQALDERMRHNRFVHSGRYPGRWNTARVGDYVNQALGLPSITFEIPYACARERVLTREDYRKAGGNIAEAVMEVI